MNKNGDDSEKRTRPVPATPSSEKSPASPIRPIPPAFEFIQVNGCKTPGCVNFGVAPREGPILKGRFSGRDGDGYKVINIGSTDLVCSHCSKSSRLKNNKAIYEERQRQGSYLWVKLARRYAAPTVTA